MPKPLKIDLKCRKYGIFGLKKVLTSQKSMTPKGDVRTFAKRRAQKTGLTKLKKS